MTETDAAPVSSGTLVLTPPGYRDIGLHYWWLAESGKFDEIGAQLADRHYSRRKPGSPQFMPPGQTIVLIAKDMRAVFGWWRPHPDAHITPMNGLDGWTCTIFRNEADTVTASRMIRDAEFAIGAVGHNCGPDGLITYVDTRKVASPNPGYCFQKAGWRKTGWSADGHKRLLQKQPARCEAPGCCPGIDPHCGRLVGCPADCRASPEHTNG